MIYPPVQSFFSTYLVSKEKAPELCASFVYLAAAVSMAVPAFCLSHKAFEATFVSVIVSFMVVECCVGLFMPVAGTLRSKYVPDALQGAILNIFRLPLNAVVVSGTYATDVLEASLVFKLVSGCFLAAALLQSTFLFESKPAAEVATSTKKKD
mmetsp:Transcript_8042/g.14216  ORF Transcript_8042/g.14216 Transcript_8042/m.14216 type:complete len:153 (+) Transcript_8042:3-461(+)